MSDDTVRATLARFGVAETALPSVGVTLARKAPPPAGPSVPLPILQLASIDDGSAVERAEFIARSQLGRGGMGVVHLATQQSIGRDVAVKTLRHADAAHERALIREARVMGGLEHPNVVPVHALGRRDDGAPVLVMKRVEGVTWRELLRDPAHAAWASLLAGHGDRLRAHVEILAQVCRALAFAHTRGFVHRDLKPDNVMVGAFGEVHVLDWGLALGLADRGTEPPGIVGTPGYMPPEMVAGDPARIDARTDVYLLGAALYEILSSRMPHEAPTPLGALASSLTGEIAPIPDTAPPELADLAREALALRMEDRPSTVEAFREGLARFLASSEVDALLRSGDRALDAAAQASASEGLTSPTVLRSLLDARSAFVAARSVRPNDARARAELARCVERLVDREIALRSPGGARAFVADLDVRDHAIEGRIAALELELERERADAEQTRQRQRQADIAPVWRIAAGITMLAATASAAFFTREGSGVSAESPLGVILWQAVVILGLAIPISAIPATRRWAFATEGSRRIFAFFVLWVSYPLLLSPIAIARGETRFDWATALVVGGLLAAAGAMHVLRGLWATVPLHFASAAAATVWPEHMTTIYGLLLVANAIVIGASLRSYVRRTRPIARARARRGSTLRSRRSRSVRA